MSLSLYIFIGIILALFESTRSHDFKGVQEFALILVLWPLYALCILIEIIEHYVKRGKDNATD